LPLTVANQSKTDEVSITSLDFSPSDTASFFIGTEEGSIHHVNRYDQPSRKAGISPNPEDAYRAHAGPITGLNFHPSTGNLDFGDLFLSSSVDWSVKLWRTKGTKAAPAGTLGANGSSASTSAGRDRRDREKEREKDAFGQVPLHSFESADDYVFDVKWHPHHPAIFGSVDGSGKFDLWNLNQDTEVRQSLAIFGRGDQHSKVRPRTNSVRYGISPCSTELIK
jgi:dynein intermediate chain